MHFTTFQIFNLANLGTSDRINKNQPRNLDTLNFNFLQTLTLTQVKKKFINFLIFQSSSILPAAIILGGVLKGDNLRQHFSPNRE